MSHALAIYNTQPVPLDQVPVFPFAKFREHIIQNVANGSRIVSLFCAGESLRLYSILASGSGELLLAAADVGETYLSMTPECPQAHWFEREMAEQWGLRPEGHPWLKPVRFHKSYRAGHDAWGRGNEPILPSVTNFYSVDGEEVHEVAVGPVHAGIIEPGHFRFQCHGENVMHLEISLGYQHRGIERALVGGPSSRTLAYMETLAGDTTIGHTLAYCQAVESLAHSEASFRAQAIRAIALELERLANHTGDLGALAGDVGYLPTASFCGRLRGDFLNMTGLACGSRFGRGWLCPGGTRQDLTPSLCGQLIERLDVTYKDTADAVKLLWNSPSVMARFEDTGAISLETCESLGLVGVAARACGVQRDVRFEYPAGIHRFTSIPTSTWTTGDVFARARVRMNEMSHSTAFLHEQLSALPDGPARTDHTGELAPDSMVVSLVEGWRGEICHVLMTGPTGRIAHYKVVDPSFHNWMGLAMALRGQQISDFPLCNKSFNLSYCGFDL